MLNITLMTDIQKQVYESCFNYLGHALTDAFEKAKKKNDKATMKRVGGYIKCLKEMFIYTNIIETELIIEKQRNEDTTSGWDRVREGSINKKNV